MKSSSHVPLLILVWLCLVQPACAGQHDGAVALSNVPFEAAETHRAAAPVAGSIKPHPGFAGKVQYNKIVAEVAHAYGLNSALLHAVISTESRYRTNAVSRKGAAGLMQLTPATARRYGVANPFDPVQNLNGGAKCLRDLLKTFNNDMNLALAAYNAGKSAVIRHGNSVPPFPETEAYVQRTLMYYRKYQSEPIL